MFTIIFAVLLNFKYYVSEAVQGAIFDSSGDLWDIGTTCETICEYILQYVCLCLDLFFFLTMNNEPRFLTLKKLFPNCSCLLNSSLIPHFKMLQIRQLVEQMIG